MTTHRVCYEYVAVVVADDPETAARLIRFELDTLQANGHLVDALNEVDYELIEDELGIDS